MRRKCENETRREGIKIVADKHIYSLKQSLSSASKGFHQVCFMAQLTNPLQQVIKCVEMQNRKSISPDLGTKIIYDII